MYPDTYHMVELRAHNSRGYSAVSSVVILTAKGRFDMISPIHCPLLYSSYIPVSLSFSFVVY